MRILIFSHAAGSPYHGPNMRWYYLGQRLLSLGCEVTIVGASWFHKYMNAPTDRGSAGEEKIDGIHYVWVKTNVYGGRLGQLINQFNYVRNALSWVRENNKVIHYDVVLASSPTPFAIFPAILASKKRSVPLVYEVRDLWPMVIQELSGKSKFHPYFLFLKYVEKIALKYASLVSSVKPGDFKYFNEEYGLEECSFLYAPNGFLSTPCDRNEDGLPLMKSDPQSGEEDILVGYIGAMSSYYGLDEFIEAAHILRDMKDVKFCLVGDGEDYPRLRKQVEKLKLDNILFTGALPRFEAIQKLNNFDICYVGLKDVAANQHGISCNKLFEYMHAGKPVIASYQTMFDPVASANCGVTVPVKEPGEIAKAIVKLKGSPELRQKLGANGKRYFYKNHDFFIVGKKYYDAFEQLIKPDGS